MLCHKQFKGSTIFDVDAFLLSILPKFDPLLPKLRYLTRTSVGVLNRTCVFLKDFLPLYVCEDTLLVVHDSIFSSESMRSLPSTDNECLYLCLVLVRSSLVIFLINWHVCDEDSKSKVHLVIVSQLENNAPYTTVFLQVFPEISCFSYFAHLLVHV